MGGRSTTSQTQDSTTQPWAPTQPMLQDILGQLQGQLGNTNLTGTETGALNTLTQNANAGNPYAGQIGGLATNLLNGGGATAQNPALQSALADYQRRLSPTADGANIGPGGNPQLQAYLDRIRSDTSNQVNGSFAAAGRDFSGMNMQTLGRGIAEGQAPVLAQQYNTDVNNMRSAADSLYGASNNTAGMLTGNNQQSLANQQAGIGAASQALDANNSSANALLQIEAARRGIPVQALGMLAQIGIPIAGLGSQSHGQSTGTAQMSGADQFAKIAGGIGSLFGAPAGGTSPVGSVFKFFSDIRLKEDVAQVGEMFDGTPIYRYRYIGSPAFHIGVIAQEIEDRTPEAVSEINGFKAVDYKLATDNAVKIKRAA